MTRLDQPALPAAGIERLLTIMARLRSPEGGCPWDLEQTFRTIAPYTIEEAYEVADAIERGDFDDLKDELGDLLFQVVFYSQMASEQGLFQFNDCVAAICDKLTRRHPHIFSAEHAAAAKTENGTARQGMDASAALQNWDTLDRKSVV